MPKQLDSSPAMIVRELLIRAGYGVDGEYAGNVYVGDDWPIFYEADPPTPDNLIFVADTAGISQGRTFDGEIQEFYGFQVTVRCIDREDGWMKAFQIRSYLAEVSQQHVVVDYEDYLISAIPRIGPLLSLGKEQGVSRRFLFSVNAMLSVRQQD